VDGQGRKKEDPMKNETGTGTRSCQGLPSARSSLASNDTNGCGRYENGGEYIKVGAKEGLHAQGEWRANIRLTSSVTGGVGSQMDVVLAPQVSWDVKYDLKTGSLVRHN